MLSEARIDWTDVGRLASDRSGWKKLVKERMDHLDVYERQLGHGYVWGDGEERLVRNERRVNEDLRCRYEGCERLCRSRAGLVRHESMMHRRVEGSSEVRVRVLWPGGGNEGRPRLSSEDVWGGEEVGRRAEGVWGMRCPSFLRELRPSRAVLQGWGEGSCGGG